MAKNVLELNGKRYDAITGAYLGTSTTTSVATAVPAKKPAQHTSATTLPKGRVIDGFMRPTSTNTHITQPRKAKPVAKPVAAVSPTPLRAIAPSAKAMHHTTKKSAGKQTEKQIAAPKPATPASTKVAVPKPAPLKAPATAKLEKIIAQSQTHKVTVHANAHKPEKSKTLMRRAVRKPEISMKPAIKPQAPAEIAAKDLSSISPKPSVLQVDEDRLERAHAVHKSQGIRHFQPVRPDYTPAAIEATPRPATHIVPAITVKQAPLVAPAPRQDADIFEAALARAESHKQPHVRPQKKHAKHRGLVNTAAGIAAFLVIGGFIGYLNMSNIQLRVASVQAGFTANMPAYKPDGYAMKGGIQRIGNTVSMRFMAGENNYTVTQQPSDWNSQTLVDNTVALSTGTYKTVQAGGRNVYIYGGSNAVWVDGGVRYDLTTNAPLSTQDITQLAASL